MYLRASFPDLNLATMLPAIDEVVMAKYMQYPDQYAEVFRTESSSRSIEQTTEVTGFGQFAVVPENDKTVYDDPLPGFNKTYQHTQYSLGFKVSRIAQDDDKYGVIRKLSSELGKSAKETKEVTAANVFNTGFTSAIGPDGQPLFSQVHPLIGGGVQSNMLPYASDPDVTSVRLALTLFRQTVDHRGKKIRIPPKKMIVPSALEFVGAELLGGNERSDTANRAINAFKRRSGLPSFESWMVWDYLSDPAAWFVEGDTADTELRWYDRETFGTVHDVEFESRAVKTAGWMRNSCGYNGFYGVVGVPSS
jgi:phage major head subunit gpT-like protein